MKITRRRLASILVIAVAGLAVIVGIYSTVKAVGQYSFGTPGVTDAEMNSEGDHLYVSYCGDDAVVELSTATMTELRRFTVVNPTLMLMSPDDTYLYVLSYVWGGRLNRIALSSGSIDWIPLDTGEPLGLCADPSGSRIWISSAVWPVPGEFLSEGDTWDHPGTGRIIEVNTSSLTITRVTAVNAAPVSVWYSAYSNRLYVNHDIPHTKGALPEQPTLNPVAVYDAQSMEKETEFFAGNENFSAYPHLQMTNWDDEGRYLCIPCPNGTSSLFSFRVIDTVSNEIAFDLFLPDARWGPIGFQYAHKVPGSDILWTVTYSGIHDEDIIGQGGTAARINTATREYEFFFVEGWLKRSGDFAVSPDGNTLYIPEITTGQIFVWSPDDNHPPVFAVTATPTSYQGPAPAAISFDGSGSSDPDPGDTLSYSWDFNGDSVFGDPYDSGTDSQPVKNYYQDYNGPVSLRVTDPHGASSDCSINIAIDIT